LRRVFVRQRQVLVALLAIPLALAGHGGAEIIQQRCIAMPHAGEQLRLCLHPVSLREIGQSFEECRARPPRLPARAPATDVAGNTPEADDDVQEQIKQKGHDDHQRDEERERHLNTPRRVRNEHVARIVESVKRDQHGGKQQCDDEKQQFHGSAFRPLRRRRVVSEDVMSGRSATVFMPCSLPSSLCAEITLCEFRSK